MSGDNRPEQFEKCAKTLSEATAELAAKNKELIDCQEERDKISSQETKLHNEINQLQLKITRQVEEMQKLAPSGTDWHVRRNSRPVRMSPSEESEARRG